MHPYSPFSRAMCRLGTISVSRHIVVTFVVSKGSVRSFPSWFTPFVAFNRLILGRCWVLSPKLVFCQCIRDSIVLLVDNISSYWLVEMVVKVLDHRRMDGRCNKVCDAGIRGGCGVERIERRKRRLNATWRRTSLDGRWQQRCYRFAKQAGLIFSKACRLRKRGRWNRIIIVVPRSDSIYIVAVHD